MIIFDIDISSTRDQVLEGVEGTLRGGEGYSCPPIVVLGIDTPADLLEIFHSLWIIVVGCVHESELISVLRKLGKRYVSLLSTVNCPFSQKQFINCWARTVERS